MEEALGLTPQQLARLVEGAADVAGQTELVAVLRTTVQTAMDLTGAQYGALGVLGEQGLLRDFIHLGLSAGVAEEIGQLPQGRGVLGTITREGQTLRLEEVAEHTDSVGFPEHHPVIHSFLGVPVRVGTRIFGNLYLGEKPGGFSEEDEAVVEALALIAGSAVATASLQERLRRLAVVEDRERIARDIHDAIIQDLFAVGLSLQALAAQSDNDALSDRIDDAVDRLDDAIAALRRFVFDLRAPMWIRRNLRHELAERVGELSSPYAAEVSLNVTGDADVVPDGTVDDLVQITGEALSNALRHSGADAVTVSVAIGRGRAVVTVIDRGKGFDSNQVSPGMGLKNLQDRAESAGGSFDLHTALGVGTTVRVELPIG